MAEEGVNNDYVSEDVLLKHLQRQGIIVAQCLQDRQEIPVSARELSLAYERELFSPTVAPKQQKDGTCPPNPKFNFYPTFTIPETLACYHIFFQNQRVPISCRANRTKTDKIMTLKEGDKLPDYKTTDEVPKIFEGLGSEEIAVHSVEEKDSSLIQLANDNPRLAVAKRNMTITHFAYPVVHLPPKIINTIISCLITKKSEGGTQPEDVDFKEATPIVTDQELKLWLATDDEKIIENRKKTMLSVALVTTLLECMQRFFTNISVIKKLEETLHYAFKHGYIKLASQISGVDLTNVITCLGILHENRLGQAVLHNGLSGEQKRDYMRDTIFLMLIHTWQTAMGVWQQFLEDNNLKELEKILKRNKRAIWSESCERTMAVRLADLVFPPRVMSALQAGLPDILSQSMMQNFRNFILERSAILPAVCNLLPTDFVPIEFKECPPTLWMYTYLFKLANYLMYHSDVCNDVTGEGLLSAYCRCNLCCPHRCLATNTDLFSETQLINTFDIRGPEDGGKESSSGLKLTPGLWTSAFLRKFEEKDYHPYQIKFYENQSKTSNIKPTACVITQNLILAQLQDIKKSREKFLLKKGQGIYLDPQTGEPLNEAEPSTVSQNKEQNEPKSVRRHNTGARRTDRLQREQRRNGSNQRLRASSLSDVSKKEIPRDGGSNSSLDPISTASAASNSCSEKSSCQDESS